MSLIVFMGMVYMELESEKWLRVFMKITYIYDLEKTYIAWKNIYKNVYLVWKMTSSFFNITELLKWFFIIMLVSNLINQKIYCKIAYFSIALFNWRWAVKNSLEKINSNQLFYVHWFTSVSFPGKY